MGMYPSKVGHQQHTYTQHTHEYKVTGGVIIYTLGHSVEILNYPILKVPDSH